MKLMVFATSLIALLLQTTAVASGPEYKFWYNYEQPLPYDPDNNANSLQLDLYNGSLPEFSATQTALTDEQQFAKAVERTNAILIKHQRPFTFASKINSYQQNIRLVDSIEQLSFKQYASRYYLWGVCSSNNYQNFLSVFEQVAKRPAMTNELLKQWLEIRFAIYHDCGSDEIAQIQINQELLNTDLSFVYLLGSIHFYQKQYLKAIEHFELIAKNDSSWLGQTSSYLVARSYLNQSQLNWRGFISDKSRIDKTQVKLGVRWLNNYIKNFPNGSYVASAKRLIIKSYWLEDDLVKFEQQLKQQLLAVTDAIFATDEFTADDSYELQGFIAEYKRKLSKPQNAVNVLINLVNDAQYQSKPTHPFYQFLVNLQHFVKAQNAYHQKQYQLALDNLANIAQPSMKQQILKAKSLAKLGQFEHSNMIFKSLYQALTPARAQPQIAKNFITQGGLERLLNSDFSLNESLYQINLARACSAQSVKLLLPKVKPAKRKHWVIYDLATRYLYQGDIDALHQLLSSYSDKILGDLALIKTAAHMVATNTDPAKGYMNIAYFMENNMRRPILYRGFVSKTTKPDPKCEQSYLTKTSLEPYDYYKKALAEVTSDSTVEAKILHFLVYCHKPQDITKACRWRYRYQTNTPNPSKKWFQRLHKKYANTKWAKKTPYYYR